MQIRANRQRRVRVHRAVSLLDVLNHAILIDDDIGPLRPLKRLILDVVAFQHTVVLQHFLVHVAQQWKLDVDLLGESGVRCGAIHAYTENFCIRGIDLA